MSDLQPDRPVFAVLCVLTVFSTLVSGSIYPFSVVFLNVAVMLCFFISLSDRVLPALAGIWPGWLLVFVAYLSCLWTVNLNASLSQAFYLAGLVLFSYITAFSAGRSRHDAVLTVVVWTAVAVSLYGVYQYAAGIEKTQDYVTAYGTTELGLGEDRMASALAALEYRRAFSTLLSPNVLACYLAMVFPPAAYLALRPGPAASRALYAAAAALMVAALLLTKSVGGLAALAVGVVVFALARGGISGVRPGRAFGLLAVLVLLAAAAGYLTLSARLGGFFGVERSYAERMNYFSGALDSFADSPIGGNGAGSFYLTYFTRIKPGAGETRFAHNLALQTLSETGMAGFAAVILVFGVFFARCYRGLRDGPDRGAFPAIMAGGAAFAAHNMVDFTFYVHETSVVFWLFFGMAVPAAAGSSAWPARFHTAAKAAAALLAVVVCFYYSSAEFAEKAHSEAVRVLDAHNMASSVMARSRPAPDEAVRLAEKAVSLKPYDDLYRAFLANLYEGAAYSRGPEYVSKAETSYKKAISLNPLYPYHQRDLGILYMRSGRVEDARDRFERASALYPADEKLRSLLSPR